MQFTTSEVQLFQNGTNNIMNIDFFSEILPPEVTHAILSLLSPTDLLKVSQVSKTFAGLLDSRGIWKRIVEEQFGPLNEQIFKGNIINWRRAFVRCSEFVRWKRHFLDGYVTWIGATGANELLSHDTSDQPRYYTGYTNHSCTFCAGGQSFGSIYFAFPGNSVLGFSTKYVLISQGSTVQLWDLTVNCKHTDRIAWESSPNKEEICIDKCSFVKNLSLTFGYWIQPKWCKKLCCVFFPTFEGITVVDLRTGEEIECPISFSEYGTKKAVEYLIRLTDEQRIIEVRVMPVNGVPMTFCHMQSINGYLFVNKTSSFVRGKKVRLDLDRKELGTKMRVVSIAQVHPITLANYHFKQRIENRVVSSPEGHVLFVYKWRYCKPNPSSIGLQNDYEIRAYLWEIGYLLAKKECRSSGYKPSINAWRTKGDLHGLLLSDVGVIMVNELKL